MGQQQANLLNMLYKGQQRGRVLTGMFAAIWAGIMQDLSCKYTGDLNIS